MAVVRRTAQGFVTASAYAPFLFHFAPHVFVGFGPSISQQLVAPDEQLATTLGAAFTIGGWLTPRRR